MAELERSTSNPKKRSSVVIASTSGDEEKEELMAADEFDDGEAECFRLIEEYGAIDAGTWRKRATISVCVHGIDDIDCTEGTCYVDFSVSILWKDLELLGRMWDGFDVEKIWRPHLHVLNSKNVKPVLEKNYWMNYNCCAHSIMCHWQRYKGTINVDLNLEQFPFDNQEIVIELASSVWKTDDVILHNATERKALVKMTEEMGLTEWVTLDSISCEDVLEVDPATGTDESKLLVVTPLNRQVGYYMGKILSVIAMLVVLSFVVFFIPGNILQDRAQIAFTLLLTTVAFHFVVGDDLPKISYHTIMDRGILIAYSYIFLVAVESVISSLLYDNKSPAASRRFDEIAGSCLAISFFIVILVFILLSRRKVARKRRGTQMNNISVQLPEVPSAFPDATPCSVYPYPDPDPLSATIQKIQAPESTLTVIVLNALRMKPAHIVQLAAALHGNKTVTLLDLSFNYVQNEGLCALAEAFTDNNTLKTLHLNQSSINDKGITAWFQPRVATALKLLDLTTNFVTAKGAAAIATAIKENRSLTALYMVYNKIGNAGARLFAEALLTNTKLKVLQLNCNEMTNSGVKLFVAPLSTNYALRFLHIGDNETSEHLLTRIKEALNASERQEKARANEAEEDD